MKFYYFLWDWFQYLIGGSVDKQKVCQGLTSSAENILEVGCATGNIAEAFNHLSHKSYTGIDIDSSAIQYARGKKLKSHIAFYDTALKEFATANSGKFDVVLLAGFFHHIPDGLCQEMLKDSLVALKNGGKIVVVDPLNPDDSSPWLSHFYSRYLEKGQYLRSSDSLWQLVSAVEGLQVKDYKEVNIGATPISAPVCARFGIIEIEKQSQNEATGKDHQRC